MTNFLNKYFTQIALVFIFTAYFFFGLQHIGQFITADEHYWIYERIPQYWRSIAEGKWKKTFINDKPGVSLALVSGSALFFEPHPETLCSENEEKIMTCQTDLAEKMLAIFRLPILVINGLILLYLFWIIQKLTNKFIALLTIIFTALSPILLGINQIVNPDSLLWSFGSATLFTFFVFLKFSNRKYAIFSGIFLGLAILSKYIASIFLPFFLLLIFLQPFFQPSNISKENFHALVKKNFLNFILIVLLAITVIIVFLPAIWIRFPILLNLLSGGKETFFSWTLYLLLFLFAADTFFFKSRFFFWFYVFFQRFHFFPFLKRILPLILFFIIITLIIGRTVLSHWPLFDVIPFDLKDLNSSENKYYNYTPMLWEKFLLEFNPLVFSLTPVAIFFLIWMIVRYFFSTNFFFKKTGQIWSFEIFSLSCFFFIYITILELSNVLAVPRYLIILYPIVSFFASIGLWDLASLLKNTLPQKFISFVLPVLIILIMIFSLFSLNTSRPFYFNYANFFLPKKALINHAWGYGGYEAAQYLNSLPNSENLTVWSDYYGVCEFFKGRCVIMEYERSSKIHYDYFVVSYRGKMLYKPDHIRWLNKKNFYATPAYTTDTPDWQLFIDNHPKNFIRVVKVAK